MTIESPTSPSHLRILRLGLLTLAGAGVIGGMIELATLHHWNSFEQLVPWFVLGLLGLTSAALLVRPGGPAETVARLLAPGAIAASAFGMYAHVKANYDTGVLNRIWGERWESLSTLDRIWHAANGDVGPSPLLASGILAQIGICLLLASIVRSPEHSAGQSMPSAMP